MSLLKYIELEGVESFVASYEESRKRKSFERTHFVSILATINGYHNFRVRPYIGMELNCKREPGNPYDRKAVKINVPSANNIDKDILDCVIHIRPKQTVRDITEQTVGRMPAILAVTLADHMDKNEVSCTAVYVGEMHHGVHDVLGAGPKLICMYFLEIEQIGVLNSIKNILTQTYDGIEYQKSILM